MLPDDESRYYKLNAKHEREARSLAKKHLREKRNLLKKLLAQCLPHQREMFARCFPNYTVEKMPEELMQNAFGKVEGTIKKNEELFKEE